MGVELMDGYTIYKMKMRLILLFLAAATMSALSETNKRGEVLTSAKLKSYVDRFNADDEELYSNIKNKDAFEFLEGNIPLFECPDEDFERTYYFRWWTYRKHVKKTEDGYVITEFMPKVSWSGKHNTISCPAGHHYYEGRWLHNARYLDDYSTFWLRKGGSPRRYSFWIADALHSRHLVTPDKGQLVELLDDLIKNYQEWEKSKRRDKAFLFEQIDDRDGMEVSIGGSGYRATINSYMYGDAIAISKIARMAGRDDVAKDYSARAAVIKQLVQTHLWDEKAQFFKVMSRNKKLADVRELHGYTPWYFHLPDEGKGYEKAWSQLMDPQGFHAPYGPTTAEQRHLGFKVSYKGHECQWNGPSWPMATSITLTGLANLLNDAPQDVIGKAAYFNTLKIYTKCHQHKREDGKVVPWIDENINPHNGDWISRTRLKTWENETWSKKKGGYERGKDYNHSTYNDLIITGLIGLRPRADDVVEVNPLLPEDTWDFFCLDNVFYHGRILTIIWDKTGKKYGKGKGLTVFADGQKIGSSERLSKVTGMLVVSEEPLIVAHRGASRQAPENTLPAFNLAWKQGADAIEGDFLLTSDGQIVCIHDKDTRRVAGKKLVVAQSTLAELRQLDVGSYRGPAFKGTRMPTIAEVFATVPKNKKIYIEIKCGTEIIPALLESIKKSGLKNDQIVVICFQHKVIQALKAKAPQFKANWLSSIKKDRSGKLIPSLESIFATLNQIKADGFSSSKNLIDETTIRAIMDKGYEHHVWTVDDERTAKRFMQWGTKSITTNVPGSLRSSLFKTREKVPLVKP